MSGEELCLRSFNLETTKNSEWAIAWRLTSEPLRPSWLKYMTKPQLSWYAVQIQDGMDDFGWSRSFLWSCPNCNLRCGLIACQYAAPLLLSNFFEFLWSMFFPRKLSFVVQLVRTKIVCSRFTKRLVPSVCETVSTCEQGWPWEGQEEEPTLVQSVREFIFLSQTRTFLEQTQHMTCSNIFPITDNIERSRKAIEVWRCLSHRRRERAQIAEIAKCCSHTLMLCNCAIMQFARFEWIWLDLIQSWPERILSFGGDIPPLWAEALGESRTWWHDLAGKRFVVEIYKGSSDLVAVKVHDMKDGLKFSYSNLSSSLRSSHGCRRCGHTAQGTLWPWLPSRLGLCLQHSKRGHLVAAFHKEERRRQLRNWRGWVEKERYPNNRSRTGFVLKNQLDLTPKSFEIWQAAKFKKHVTDPAGHYLLDASLSCFFEDALGDGGTWPSQWVSGQTSEEEFGASETETPFETHWIQRFMSWWDSSNLFGQSMIREDEAHACRIFLLLLSVREHRFKFLLSRPIQTTTCAVAGWLVMMGSFALWWTSPKVYLSSLVVGLKGHFVISSALSPLTVRQAPTSFDYVSTPPGVKLPIDMQQ